MGRHIETCGFCGGSGKDTIGMCPICNGKGVLSIQVDDRLITCNFCKGSGRDPGIGRCPVCYGSGYISVTGKAKVEK